MENVYAEMLAWSSNEQAKYLRGFADGEGKATMNSWVLKILDRESITKFTELIGFSNPEKMGVLQQIIASYR